MKGIFNIKAIIFDLDGVICSSDQYHYLAWKKLTSGLNIYFDEKINNRLRGISRMDSLNIILEKSERQYSDEEKKALTEEKNKIYKGLLRQMTKNNVDKGVRDSLKELKNRGYKLAIGSSSKNARLILHQIELGNAFDVIADGTHSIHSKPDPEVFLYAASKLNEKPENCLVVEDAMSGIAAAKAAGMTAFALYGDAKECGLEDYNLKSFSELCEILP